jgi:hypothetical protein
MEDFQKGAAHVAAREDELASLLTPAEELYSGQQHVRLMRGLQIFRAQFLANDKAPSVDLWILSAGYGLVPANRRLAPYECTFQGMKTKTLRDWADRLNVPIEFRHVLIEPYDLGLFLLGDAYLKACAFDETVQLGGQTLLFCGTRQASRLPRLANLRTIILSNAEAKHFSCGLVGLKGELGARLLEYLTHEPAFLGKLCEHKTDILTVMKGVRKHQAGPC